MKTSQQAAPETRFDVTDVGASYKLYSCRQCHGSEVTEDRMIRHLAQHDEIARRDECGNVR